MKEKNKWKKMERNLNTKFKIFCIYKDDFNKIIRYVSF